MHSTLADLGGAREAYPRSRSNFVHFHAVFGKKACQIIGFHPKQDPPPSAAVEITGVGMSTIAVCLTRLECDFPGVVSPDIFLHSSQVLSAFSGGGTHCSQSGSV